MKTIEETKPQRKVELKPFKGNGGFTYITVPWIIAQKDEGCPVSHDGKAYVPVCGDMMCVNTTFVLESEVEAWRKWSRN